MRKQIFIQTQGVQSGGISPVKPVGFIAINIDGIKITFDAYDGSGPDAIPRTDSLIELVTEKDVFRLTPAYLVAAVKFFHRYEAMGSDVVRFKNVFHVVMPDKYRDAQIQAKNGLKF